MLHRVQRIYDRFRWLRSDGTPNFSQRLSRKPGYARLISKPVKNIYSPNISILKAFEIAYQDRSTVIPLIKIGRKVDSVVSLREFISLLGGSFSTLIEIKHRGFFIETLNRETARSISRRDFPSVGEDSDLREVLETIVLSEGGYVVVLDKDQNLIGLITERDLIRYLREKITGIKVRDVMTENIAFVRYGDKLCDVIREMNILNVRRFPVVRSDGSIAGIVRAIDIVYFIGSHDVFRYLTKGSYDEFCQLPVDLVMKEVSIISDDRDIGEASERMLSEDIDYFLVLSEGEIKGIITERDIIYGLAVLS
ncbi:MAG: CBS domain-containing protein [Sulfolobales archaeon]